QVQALMSVLEGYSNFVMHRVGRKHLQRADDLEAAMHRRRDQRTLVERLIMALTGLELKMRQYEIGEQFCEGVVERSDQATLNRVWESAEMMPSMAELKNPDRWLARIRSKPLLTG
ncbi:MAG TPA: zinc-dependent metalloprotease, partial [Candidatus Dormibacteraeota bacterium]